jgi:hypothetical protein
MSIPNVFSRYFADAVALLCFALLCFALLCFALLCFASRQEFKPICLAIIRKQWRYRQHQAIRGAQRGKQGRIRFLI